MMIRADVNARECRKMPIGATNADDGKRNGGGSRSYARPAESVVGFLIAELKDNGGNSIEYPTFEGMDTAVAVDDDVRAQIEDEYGINLPDYVDDLSIESLFNKDWDNYDYIGHASNDDDVGKVNANGHTDLNTAINGYFADEVAQAFGENARIRMGISPEKWRDEKQDRGRHTRVMVTTSKHQREMMIKDQNEVGEISEDEKNELMAELEAEEDED